MQVTKSKTCLTRIFIDATRSHPRSLFITVIRVLLRTWLTWILGFGRIDFRFCTWLLIRRTFPSSIRKSGDIWEGGADVNIRSYPSVQRRKYRRRSNFKEKLSYHLLNKLRSFGGFYFRICTRLPLCRSILQWGPRICTRLPL